MPTAKKQPAASRARAPRRARVARRSSTLPALEQRQLDLIGLGAGRARRCSSASSSTPAGTAARAGSQAVEGLRWLLGAAHYVVPVGAGRRPARS